MSDFVAAYWGDVATADQELHHLGAFAGKLGPSRRGRRILLEAADALAGKFEIHLRELAFRRALHGIGIAAYDYTLFAFDERLTPDGQQRFIQVGLLVFFGHCQSVPRQSLSSEANHSAPLLPSCRVKREGHETHILIYAVGICFCRCVCLCCFCADPARSSGFAGGAPGHPRDVWLPGPESERSRGCPGAPPAKPLERAASAQKQQ